MKRRTRGIGYGYKNQQNFPKHLNSALAFLRQSFDNLFREVGLWTCPSPTGSDPEGSSPNETDAGHVFSLPLLTGPGQTPEKNRHGQKNQN